MLPAFRRYWHGDSDDLQLLLDWKDEEAGNRFPWALGGTGLYHLLAIALFLSMPAPPPRAVERFPVVDFRRATPLIAPILPSEMTQKAPNKGKVAKEIDLASLLPKPAVQQPPVVQAGKPSSAARQFEPPPAASMSPKATMDAPKLDVAQQGVPQAGPPPAGVQIQPQEKPKLALENVGAPTPSQTSGNSVLKPRIELPKTGLEEVVKGAVRQSGRGLVIGDADTGGGSVSEMLRQSPSPGRTGSQLELLSDPLGVDFRPYLTQVLAAVRRNWMAILPESARLGRQGRCVVQFSISRQGSVPKLVIAIPSGADALDRAAVAGISMSNPFPPLPNEFKGEQIRLQLNFAYNMPRQR